MTTKKTFAQLLVLPAILVTLSATATEFDQPGDGPFFGETANGQWLIGAKFVSMYNSDDGIGEEESTNGGLLLGYEFARPVWKGKASFEFEYLPTLKKGEINGIPSSNPSIYPAGGEWENPLYSGYIAYRTAGRLYAKGKVGIVASRFKIRTTAVVQETVDILDEVEVIDPATGFPVVDPDTGLPTGDTTQVVVGQKPVGPAVGEALIVQENKTQIGFGLGLGVHITKNFDLEFEYEGNQGKAQLYNLGINAIVRLP